MHRLQMQRILLRAGPAVGAFDFLKPHRMPLTIVVVHIGDGFRVDLNQATRRAQRFEIRIFAECLVANKHLRMVKLDILFVIPEVIKRWQMNAASFALLYTFLPDAFQPAHFVQPFGKGFFAIKATAQLAENIKVVARLKLRRHDLFHGDNATVRVVTVLVEIVTLKLRGRRQYDIGKAAG